MKYKVPSNCTEENHDWVIERRENLEYVESIGYYWRCIHCRALVYTVQGKNEIPLSPPPKGRKK